MRYLLLYPLTLLRLSSLCAYATVLLLLPCSPSARLASVYDHSMQCGPPQLSLLSFFLFLAFADAFPDANFFLMYRRACDP